MTEILTYLRTAEVQVTIGTIVAVLVSITALAVTFDTRWQVRRQRRVLDLHWQAIKAMGEQKFGGM